MEQQSDAPPYTVSEVAKKLRFTPPVIRKAAREGRLPAFRVGREWRFPPARIDRLVKHGAELAEE